MNIIVLRQVFWLWYRAKSLWEYCICKLFTPTISKYYMVISSMCLNVFILDERGFLFLQFSHFFRGITLLIFKQLHWLQVEAKFKNKLSWTNTPVAITISKETKHTAWCGSLESVGKQRDSSVSRNGKANQLLQVLNSNWPSGSKF